MSTCKFIFCLLLLLRVSTPNAQVIRYVRYDGSGNGGTWGSASNDLQLMINNSVPGDQVWVATGTYLPVRPAYDLTITDPKNRNNAFVMKAGVKIYGGFKGIESSLSERKFADYVTTLSGDFNGNDQISGSGITLSIKNNGENAFHVIIATRDNGSVGTLDGFTINGGNANLEDNYIPVNGQMIPTFDGGGLYNYFSSLTVVNCRFTGNTATSAGGIYNYSSSSAITNCSFLANHSTKTFGGGIYNNRSSPAVTNCSFSNNNAAYGGGMYNNNYSAPVVARCSFVGNYADFGGGVLNDEGSFPTVTGCNFANNNAATNGGGMFIYYSSSSTVTNCSFAGNTATDGGGMYNYTSNAAVTNCSFSGNHATDGAGMYNYSSSPAVTNCSLAGNTAGTGGGMLNSSSFPIITNCIIWGNTGGSFYNDNGSSPTVAYSDVQGLTPLENGNMDKDPLFADMGDPDGADNIYGTADDGIRLKDGSPVIDKGSNSAYDVSKYGNADLASYIRISGTAIDMGAYEADNSPLSVVWGTITAITKNGQLIINWTTETEINNRTFIIEASANGKTWQTIGEVKSKAKNGSSAEKTAYSFTKSLGGVAFGFAMLAFGVSGFANRRRRFIAAALLLAGAVMFSYSCNKGVASTTDNNNSYKYIRITQQNMDGTKKMSGVIKVVED